MNVYHLTNIFNVYNSEDVGYFYNLLRTVNFPLDIDTNAYNTYTVEPMDTWASISWKVYNSIFLWWSICALNNIQNPVIMPAPGTVLKVLKPRYLQNILSNITTE